MTLEEIRQQFALCKSWEDRYRLLIQFSRLLPKPNDAALQSWQEIHGCESRLWVSLGESAADFQAYSDARLMQGILWVLIVSVKNSANANFQHFQLQPLLDEFQLSRQLSVTRLNGIKQIEAQIQQNYGEKVADFANL